MVVFRIYIPKNNLLIPQDWAKYLWYNMACRAIGVTGGNRTFPDTYLQRGPRLYLYFLMTIDQNGELVWNYIWFQFEKICIWSFQNVYNFVYSWITCFGSFTFVWKSQWLEYYFSLHVRKNLRSFDTIYKYSDSISSFLADLSLHYELSCEQFSFGTKTTLNIWKVVISYSLLVWKTYFK